MLNFSARLRKKTRESNGICGIQHYLCKVNLKIHIYEKTYIEDFAFYGGVAVAFVCDGTGT